MVAISALEKTSYKKHRVVKIIFILLFITNKNLKMQDYPSAVFHLEFKIIKLFLEQSEESL